LFAQPIEDESGLTPSQKHQARLNALGTASVIKSSTEELALVLDHSWDWYNNIGAMDNEIYFNVFHKMFAKDGGTILNRYCGDLVNASYSSVSLERVGVKLNSDKTDMQFYCTIFGDRDVDITTLGLPMNVNSALTLHGGNFNIKAKIFEDYQAYYELYSVNKKIKLVFFSSNKGMLEGFPTNIKADYREYLVDSYVKELDQDGYLKKYGMNFNHVGSAHYADAYCASVQAVNASGSSKEIGNIAFYIKGEKETAKCAGVPDYLLVKIELADPGVDSKELLQQITYADATFNIITKGYLEDFERP
jgi:hypothetical protein